VYAVDQVPHFHFVDESVFVEHAYFLFDGVEQLDGLFVGLVEIVVVLHVVFNDPLVYFGHVAVGLVHKQRQVLQYDRVDDVVRVVVLVVHLELYVGLPDQLLDAFVHDYFVGAYVFRKHLLQAEVVRTLERVQNLHVELVHGVELGLTQDQTAVGVLTAHLIQDD